MKNLIKIKGGGNIPILLGTATSFNVKTLVPNVDYTKLTADNFFIKSVSGVGDFEVSVSGIQEHPYGKGSFTKSYNASTGVLSCYYGVTAYGKYNGAVMGSETKNASVTVYLIEKLS